MRVQKRRSFESMEYKFRFLIPWISLTAVTWPRKQNMFLLREGVGRPAALIGFLNLETVTNLHLFGG